MCIRDRITTESARTAIEAISGEQMFLGPEITCDGQQWAGVATACSQQSIAFRINEDGSYEPSNPDGFIDTPKDIIDVLS